MIKRKGYIAYTSRRKDAPIKRNERAHRAVIKYLLKCTDERTVNAAFQGNREMDPTWQVHHMDFDKCNNAPSNLLYTPEYFNPSPARRDPYSGQYLSPLEYEQRYGSALIEPVKEMEPIKEIEPEPDWVFMEDVTSYAESCERC